MTFFTSSGNSRSSKPRSESPETESGSWKPEPDVRSELGATSGLKAESVLRLWLDEPRPTPSGLESLGSRSAGSTLTGVCYLALLLASNLTLPGCEKYETPGVQELWFDEPRLLETAKPAKASVPRPEPPTRAEPRLSTNLYEYCHHGLQSSERPEVDVRRLGVLCGGINGLAPAEPAFAGNLKETGIRRSYEFSSGTCLRVAVALSPALQTVEVEWLTEDASVTLCTIDSLGWCPESGALCWNEVQREAAPSNAAPVASRVELIVRTVDTEGEFAARVWQRGSGFQHSNKGSILPAHNSTAPP